MLVRSKTNMYARRMAFNASVITLYPEAFPGLLGVSIFERARRQGLWSLETVNLREFGLGRPRQVAEPPTGGGAHLGWRLTFGWHCCAARSPPHVHACASRVAHARSCVTRPSAPASRRALTGVASSRGSPARGREWKVFAPVPHGMWRSPANGMYGEYMASRDGRAPRSACTSQKSSRRPA